MSDIEEKIPVKCMHNQHHWDNGVRTEGVPGGYTFTCILCKEKKTGWRITQPGNAPDTRVRMSKKMRRKLGKTPPQNAGRAAGKSAAHSAIAGRRQAQN